jgi:hypothetical protein
VTASLTVKYEFSRDDDFGWFAATVRTSQFSGSGGFWVQWQDVEEWAATLLAYPLPAKSEHEADWGHCESDSTNYRPIVQIAIKPANKTGDLDVEVHLGDHLDDRQFCRVAFLTNYPDLERFGGEMRAMMKRERNEAMLTGRSAA